ncbi:MAG: hypothetical protein KC646_16640 [Candidatus Cloacimonetes bacterium]|nr:hypothetical protein [Candidatus Cloacimonadota bacterium]
MEEREVENLEEIDQVLDELLDQMPANEKSILLQEVEESSSQQAEDLIADISKKSSSLSFAEVLQEEELEVLKEEAEPLLSEEERSFFFEQSQETASDTHFVDDFMNSDVVDVQALDENQEIYEDVILSPVLQDTKRLYFICLAALCMLFGLVCILCFMQNSTQNMILENRASIKTISKGSMGSDFLSMPIVQQKQAILLKLNSSLSTKEEKALCNFFLASFAYQDGDMKAGRRFMLEGVKLRDDK